MCGLDYKAVYKNLPAFVVHEALQDSYQQKVILASCTPIALFRFIVQVAHCVPYLFLCNAHAITMHLPGRRMGIAWVKSLITGGSETATTSSAASG